MAPEDQKIGNNTIDALLTIVVAIAAVNWTVIEFLETDLLIDVAGLSGSSLTLAYAGVGVAAVVSVYNTAVWMGWTGMEGS
jgi:uncharacterized membrane protein YuzA (DUF378 family)